MQSPSGGLHLYFHATPEVPHVFGQHAFGPDVNSPNYVLFAGSITSEYNKPYWAIERRAVATAPTWFNLYLRDREIERVSQIPVIIQDQPQHIAWAIRYLIADAPPAIQGAGGDGQTFVVACVLKDQGISKEMAFPLMSDHYNPRCIPQWSPEELTTKIENAYQYGTQLAPGEGTAEHDFAGCEEGPEEIAAL